MGLAYHFFNAVFLHVRPSNIAFVDHFQRDSCLDGAVWGTVRLSLQTMMMLRRHDIITLLLVIRLRLLLLLRIRNTVPGLTAPD